MVVVTIVNSVTETSMPVNEFVIYRAKKQYSIKEILIVCDKIDNLSVYIPNNINVYYINNSVHNLREVLKSVIKEYDKNNIIFHIHHERAAFYFYGASLFMSLGNRVLYTVHSSYKHRDIKYKILSFCATLCSKYVSCVSKTSYNTYNKFIRFIKGDKMVPILNGVDTDRLDTYRNDKFSIDNRKNIFYIARMIPLKNHEFLLKLIRELDGYSLILIGAEDKSKRIRRMVEKYGIANRVRIIGQLERNKLFGILEKGAIYASPSKVEGLPVSVLEAMSCGLIPILSNISPHMEIAYKVDFVKTLPLEINIWKNTIMNLSKMNSKEIETVSNNIIDKTKDEFSLEVMHRQYIMLYKRILDNNI